MFLPNATDEPHQQEEPEPWSQASQTPKQPIDCQRHDQNPATPLLVSQVTPHVATHHHSWKTRKKDELGIISGLSQLPKTLSYSQGKKYLDNDSFAPYTVDCKSDNQHVN